jgi:DNA-binding beta-propeller fold protein YncE
MRTMPRFVISLLAAMVALVSSVGAMTNVIPDGRTIAPAGFTIPVEGFASAQALSPDGRWLAVLSQDGAAVDLLSTQRSTLADRLAIPAATNLAWTSDGLFVSRGYTGTIARYRYDAAASKTQPMLAKQIDMQVASAGLVNGIAEDPTTHRLAVARTADREVVVLDNDTGAVLARHATSGQPFAVGFAGNVVLATLYDSDHVEAWRGKDGDAVQIATGPHPTQLLIDGTRAFVANADGHDVVVIDTSSLAVTQRYDLAVTHDAPPGQTPAGMALSADRATLYVAESGFNDVAVIDVASGVLRGRVPTGWYPTTVTSIEAPTVPGKDARPKAQLWIANAKGWGSQPDPGGEWDGTYSGLEQHVVVTPSELARWTATVARNDRFAAPAVTRAGLPPIAHVVFIVRENKHFDEEFGDEPQADSDPALLVFGRKYTPNAHALAEHYTLFDNFMTDGEASIYGHAWTTQGMVNDYHERNAHVHEDGIAGVDARVATAIWPYPIAGEESATPAQMDFDWFTNLADLPGGPRINVSGVFGPRGELIDELARKNVSFRVYGEQMTVRSDGTIAPELTAHADRACPGDHIDFGVLDVDRAKLFLDDVSAHGLAAYSYLTLPTDHTAGFRAGFYSPPSYVANNDVALGQIIAGLSRRPDWKNTIVIVTCDDAQGTGDHVDGHRMPAFAIGPYIRRSFVSHVHYSQSSILRTVEVLFGLNPLNVYDAVATPMLDMFAQEPVIAQYGSLAANVPMERNPGMPTRLSFTLDGADAAQISLDEWRSVRTDAPPNMVAAADDDR